MNEAAETVTVGGPETAAPCGQVHGLVRPGGEALAMMDCPVFCIQEKVPTYDDNDNYFEYWKTTEGLWFTYEEARAWAESHEYRFNYPWRVYGLPARGQLKKLLKAHTALD